MENSPNPFFDRIILPKESISREQDIHNYVIENVINNGGETIEHLEQPKNESDLETIGVISNYVDELLQKYGREKQVPIPAKNIHILREGGVEEFTKGRLKHGAHAVPLRSIVIDRFKSDLDFAACLFHEMLHAKSYTALQMVGENEDAKLETYRAGISVVARDGRTVYLENVEEAVINYLTDKFVEDLESNAMLLPKIDRKDISSSIILKKDNSRELNTAIDEIYQRNYGKFYSRQDVLNLFIDAQVNGNLLKLAKIVENTFGKGTMKKIDFYDID